MPQRKTKMATKQAEKNLHEAYLGALQSKSDMEVWQEFQRVMIPDEWDRGTEDLVFTKEGLWRLERCREEMTDRLHFAYLRDTEEI